MNRLKFGIFNPIVDVSQGSIDLYEDAEKTDMDDVGEITDLMRDYIGEHQHIRVAFFPHAGFRVANVGLLVGGLAQASIDLDVRNPAWPEAHIDYVQDTGLLAGAGLKVPVTGLRIGVSAKSLTRSSLDTIYTAADIADDDFDKRMEDDMESGAGFSLDVGAIYTLPFVPLLKTDVGVVIQNIPEMDMGDAEDVKTQVNFGLAVEKSLAKFTLVGCMDYMDITQQLEEDDDIGKRLHLGVELKTPFFVSVRAGINQGYLTVGATADFRFVRFDFAAYTEEVGAYAGQRADERYVGQLTFGW
jgi:hypothetical protein